MGRVTQPVNVTPACPFLGLPDDPQSHFSFPEHGHTCRAHDRAWRIDLAHQASYCLSGNHMRCSRFQTAARPLPTAPQGIVMPPPERDQPNGMRHSKNTNRRRIWWRAVTAVLAVLMLVTIVVVLAFSPPAGAPGPTPTNNDVTIPPLPTSPLVASLPPTPTPTLAPTLTPTAIPSPTPIPTPSPPPTPAASPTPTPSIHVVQRGETLWDIGKLYGVYWLTIADANQLEHPDRIYPGQELIIPQPGSTLRPTATP